MFAATLPVPARPDWHTNSVNLELGKNEHDTDLYNNHDVRIYQKARWWRNLNRFMSFTGLCVIVIVVSHAVPCWPGLVWFRLTRRLSCRLWLRWSAHIDELHYTSTFIYDSTPNDGIQRFFMFLYRFMDDGLRR